MSNLINSEKAQVVNLVKQWRDRSGLGVKQIVARMQANGHDISPAVFENHFTTRLEQAPNIPPDWVVALIQAFREGLLEAERCRAEEAIELARLTRLPAEQIKTLKKLFPIREFDKAYRRYLLTLGEASEVDNLSGHAGYYLRRTDWGEAPEVSIFYGRQAELTRLKEWLVVDRCRLVGVLGLGGIGKTALATKLAEQIKDEFDYTIWRSLSNAPPLNEILSEWIHFLSNQRDTELPNRVERGISRLMDYLQEQRCLLILDNFETILRQGDPAGHYQPGYELYGELLRRIGESRHQSCLVLTSREKPGELSFLEGASYPVRVWSLAGLKEAEGRAVIEARGAFWGSDEDWRELIEQRYAGNPLALKIVSTTIQQLFAGNISNFLKQSQTVSGDIANILEDQFNRLSALEKELMYWLAIEREPVLISTLAEDLVSPVSQAKLLETLESLSRRSLIEQIAAGFEVKFTLQNVLLEYVTERLVDQVCTELRTGVIALFQSHALIKAQAKDYIRESQTRLILAPVADRLRAIAGLKVVEDKLKHILATLRESQPRTPGYTGGNTLNLLVQLESEIQGADFSHLAVWQAYLPGVELQDVNFAYADLATSVFAEMFGGITSVAFSPDSKFLAGGTTQSEIRLWHMAHGQPSLTCQGHLNWVLSVAFSPDGHILASGSADQTIRLWDTTRNTGQALQTWLEHTGQVNALAFSPDSHLLVSGSADRTVRLWEVSSGQCLQIWSDHTHHVRSVVFSPDGQMIASGSADQTIRLWRIGATECLKTLTGHTGWVRSVAFSPDGHLLVSGSDDRTIRLWDVETGECHHILSEHTGPVRSVAFSPNGRLLASGGEDQKVRLWDPMDNTGQLLRTLSGHTDWVLAVAFSPDGQILASGSYNQVVRLWEVSTGQCLKTWQGYTHWITSVTFSSDGQMLMSGHDDQTIRSWEVGTGQCFKIWRGHTDWVASVVASADGQTLVSGSADRTIRWWAIDTGQCLKTWSGHEDWVWSVALSPDGQVLASGSQDRTVRLWEVSSGQRRQVLSGHTDIVRSVAFSPDGRSLASGSDDRTIRLWEVSSGQCRHILSEHTGWVLAVAFSPDDRFLASGSEDRTIRLWAIETGQCIKTLSEHTGRVRTIAFSPTGGLLASGSEDQLVRLWDTDTGQCLRTLAGHSATVKSVAFNPTGDMLASAGDDGTIRLWDPQTGACLKTLRPDRPYERMNIAGATGLTETQKAALKALGAVEKPEASN